MTPNRRRTPLIALAAVALIALTGCATDSSATEEAAQGAGAWPRVITHEAGETEIPAQPERIVSTSLSVTGTLLAIDAPIVASAASGLGPITDESGFFLQWSEVAADRGVEVLYPNLELDLEAVIAQDPDLIVVSTSGADSVLDHWEELNDIAPTIVVNYGDKTWQDLATELGEATGLEDAAAATIAEFDATTSELAESITAPEGGVSIVSYNGAGSENPVGKTTGPHAQLFEALGIEVLQADDALDTSEQQREDFAFIAYENLSAAVTGDSVFLISAEEDDVDTFTSDPILANLKAVQSGQVYPLGLASFRIDFYSASDILATIADIYAD